MADLKSNVSGDVLRMLVVQALQNGRSSSQEARLGTFGHSLIQMCLTIATQAGSLMAEAIALEPDILEAVGIE
jgi:hypothetical protein